MKKSGMKTLTLELPEEINEVEVRMIIAVALFEQGLLSSGQAAELAGMNRREFLEEVGKYGVSIFGENASDIENIRHLEI